MLRGGASGDIPLRIECSKVVAHWTLSIVGSLCLVSSSVRLNFCDDGRIRHLSVNTNTLSLTVRFTHFPDLFCLSWPMLRDTIKKAFFFYIYSRVSFTFLLEDSQVVHHYNFKRLLNFIIFWFTHTPILYFFFRKYFFSDNIFSFSGAKHFSSIPFLFPFSSNYALL